MENKTVHDMELLVSVIWMGRKGKLRGKEHTNLFPFQVALGMHLLQVSTAVVQTACSFE